MYVRANQVSVDPARLDDLVGYVQDQVLPAAQGQQGNRGLVMAVDRDSGRCTIVSFWDDLDTLHSSEAGISRFRDGAREQFGATLDVMVAEVLDREVREQPRPGCWNRVTMLDVAPGDIDPAAEAFRASTLPGLMAIDGFCAAMLTTDRDHGRAVAVTTWRDREALDASAERATTLREEVRDKAHGEIASVWQAEIVIWHMTE